MAKHDPKRNLKPFTSETGRAAGKKGGSVKSVAKTHSSRLNGLWSKKNLSRQDKEIIVMMRDNNIGGLIRQLIERLLIDESNDPKMIAELISKLTALLPKVTMNYEVTDSLIVKVCYEILEERGLLDVAEEITRRLQSLQEGAVQ